MKMLLKVLLIFLLRGLNDVQASDDSHVINDSRHIKPRQKRYSKGYNPENSGVKGSSAVRSCKICGQSFVSPPAGMVVKGNDVNPPFKYPWSVVFQIQGEAFCGGSLLNENYVLTAAHCLIKQEHEEQKGKTVKGGKKKVKYMKPNELTVSFVTEKSRVTQPGPPVEAIIPHPGFAKSLLKHDIALVKLSRKITCDKFKIPICLPATDVKVNIGQIFTIVGWGTAGNHSKDASETLQEAIIRRMSFNKCKGSFPSYMESLAYCLMGIRGQSPCMGDSGGPMFDKRNGKYYLYGVTSIHSSEVCDANTPFLYTSVPKHIQWIKNVMGSSFPNQGKQKTQYFKLGRKGSLGFGRGLKGSGGGVHKKEEDTDLSETPYSVEPTENGGSQGRSQGSNGGDVDDRLPEKKGGSPILRHPGRPTGVRRGQGGSQGNDGGDVSDRLPDTNSRFPGLSGRCRSTGVPVCQGSNRDIDGFDVRDRLPQTKEGFSGLPYPGRSIGDPDFNPDRGSRGRESRNNQGISGPVRPKVDPDFNPHRGSRQCGSRSNQVDPDFNPDRGSRRCGSRINQVDPDFNPDRGSRRCGSRTNQGISGPVRPKVDPDFIPDRGSRRCGSRNNQGWKKLGPEIDDPHEAID